MTISTQFNPVVNSFQTENPGGPNSTYTKLPDGRWAREKKATGGLHIAGTTRFVHPQYGDSREHPVAGVNSYSPLELATAHGELIGESGQIQHKVAGKNGKSVLLPVPDEHISNEPKPGWYPVEHTMGKDNKVSSYHLGHPVAQFTKENFR